MSKNIEIGVMQHKSNLTIRKMKNPMIPICNPDMARICAMPEFEKVVRIFLVIPAVLPVVSAFAMAAVFFGRYFSMVLSIECLICSIKT